MKNEAPEILRAGLFDSRAKFGAQRETPPHAIDWYEIEFFEEEGGAAHLNGERYPIHPGMVLCCKPGDLRHSELPLRCYFVHVARGSGYYFDILNSLPPTFTCQNTESYIPLLRELAQARHFHSSIASHLHADSLLLELIARLHREAREAKRKENLASEKNYLAVKQAIAYIDEHLAAGCSLAELAAAVNFSPVYFHSLFRRVTGKTPYAYLADRRITAAKELLALSDQTLGEIADACGFSSLSYFDLTFRRACGCTPSAYRRDMQAKYETP